MAIKKLAGQDPKPKGEKTVEQDDDKLNIREFLKAHTVKDGTPFGVEKCKWTLSGWLLVETTHWIGFISARTTVSKNLQTEIAPALHGQQGNQLIALVAKKSKFGFVLATDDEVKRWYDYNTETNTLEITEEQQESFFVPTGALKLEDFLGTPST